MERRTFVLKAHPGQREEAQAVIDALSGSLSALCQRHGVENFSIWGVGDYFFGYGEYTRLGGPEEPSETEDAPEEQESGLALWETLSAALCELAEPLCAPGTMTLMYRELGDIQADKSLIRHRVFAATLKRGCEAEYKRRHDALSAEKALAAPGEDSNFTIWYGEGVLFGYCEKIVERLHEPTEAERAFARAWESDQLELMDWLSDDVDWLTGERHEAMRRVL